MPFITSKIYEFHTHFQSNAFQLIPIFGKYFKKNSPMKNLSILVALFSILGLTAQNKVAQDIASLQSVNTNFKSFTVLNATSTIPTPEINRTVENATFALIANDGVNAIFKTRPEHISLRIPYNGSEVSVLLFKAEIANELFHVDTDKKKNVAYIQGAHYRGIVEGDMNSVVSMNFFADELNGIISSTSLNNLVVGKIDKKFNASEYIIYSDANMKISNDFRCDVRDDASIDMHVEHDEESRDISSAKCVTLYFEVDYDLYLANGSSVTTTTNWMTSVFNNVQTLYANDGISTALKSVFVWTQNDPYSGTSSSDYLYQFQTLRQVFDGDLGQLVSMDPGGLGGVAFLNGICNTNNYSYSDVNLSYSSVPLYSWTVQVITHELGHQMGSRHTHACGWNGNNTAIDGCGSQAGYSEGSCAIGPIPSAFVKGTIMSYCHLIGGVGISFNNGFGPQPTTTITGRVNAGTCLSSDCINTCINTIANVVTPIVTNNSISLNWDDLGGSSNWQIAVLPISGTFANYISKTVTNHVFTGLTPNTYYKIRLRPLCSGATSTAREIIVATTADWCSGVIITDTGGTTNNHGNMESFVRTFIPNEANKKIKMEFTAFGLEDTYDYLYIYDGANTDAPLVSGSGFTGTNSPGTIISTAADGSLTLRFASDPLENDIGFTANISCEDNLGTSDFGVLDFSYFPNPTNGIVTISSKTEINEVNVYNIAGQLLYNNKVNNLQANVDISAFSTGTYFFKVQFGEISKTFKIVKM